MCNVTINSTCAPLFKFDKVGSELILHPSVYYNVIIFIMLDYIKFHI